MDKPRIRFKGYTDAWEQRKLGNICESFEYGLNAAAKEYDGKNKYIRITDIDDSSHEFLQEDPTLIPGWIFVPLCVYKMLPAFTT